MNVRLAAVASARAAVPRASGGRSHMLARLAAVVLALLVVANCKPAYADTDGAVMYSTSDGGGYNAVVRDVTNRYDAALVCLGYSRSAVTGAEMETKLSNEGTGGRFWEFAQTFFTDVAADNIPGWSPTWLYGSILANGWVYGDTFARSLWWTETTQELYNGALEDLKTVLRGGSLGGGGVSGDAFTFACTVQYTTGSTYMTVTSDTTNRVTSAGEPYYQNDGLGLAPSTVNVTYSRQYVEAALNTFGSGYSTDYMACRYKRYSGGRIDVNLMFFPDEATYEGAFTETTNQIGNLSYTYLRSNGYSTTNKRIKCTNDSLNGSGGDVFIDQYGGSSSNFFINDTPQYAYGKLGVASGGGGGTNNWPDPDPTPVPDPDPTEPVVPDPDPTPVPDPGPIDDPVLPDPDPIDNPSTGGGTTIVYAPPTDTTLIENWLSVIYDAITQGFNAVTTDMATHCQHIQTKLTNLYEVMMSTLGKYLTNQTSSINNNLSNQTWWLARQIGNQFEGLMDYMHELTVWLAEQMDYSFTDTGYGYDDTSVVAWLKKIYAKLGTGGGTSKPTDPVEEPDNWWDWLLRALQNWVNGLGDVAGDLLGNLNELLGGLLDKFPFGIPWMTLEVITLLAADPVTPVFTVDYTVYTIPIHYEVDLSPYETAAATIRAMVYIVFGGFLLLKTPKVISEMMGVFE